MLDLSASVCGVVVVVVGRFLTWAEMEMMMMMSFVLPRMRGKGFLLVVRIVVRGGVGRKWWNFWQLRWEISGITGKQLGAPVRGSSSLCALQRRPHCIYV